MIKSLAIEKVKKLIPELGKQTGFVRKAEEQVLQRISELEVERESLINQPITRDDFAALICADIDRIANKHRDSAASNLRRKMSPGARGRVHTSVGGAMEVAKWDGDSLYSGLRDLCADVDGDRDPLFQGAATFLFRDEMKRAAKEAVAAIDPWPYPDARPMAESLARLDAIAAELDQLGAERTELAELLQSVGIGTHEEPEPEPVEGPPLPPAYDWEPTRENGYMDPRLSR